MLYSENGDLKDGSTKQRSSAVCTSSQHQLGGFDGQQALTRSSVSDLDRRLDHDVAEFVEERHQTQHEGRQ